jgi:hypothetical protein
VKLPVGGGGKVNRLLQVYALDVVSISDL